jgi:hypothetical protein
MHPQRVRLEEKDFAELVQGKTIQLKAHTGNVVAEVALADIGFDRMYFHIELAMRDSEASC